MMKRILSIWFHNLPIERLRREKWWHKQTEQPNSFPCDEPANARAFALVSADTRGQRISAANKSAHKAGVMTGMALADARAVCPTLFTLPSDDDADRVMLHKLARWCGRYSPVVSIDEPYGLYVDITGCDHLLGGEDKLMHDLESRMKKAGFSTRLGLADTPAAAWGIARFYSASDTNFDGRLAEPGRTDTAIANLPIAALNLATETELLLTRLGLKTIGALMAIPRTALEQRSRSKMMSENILQRLDEALGLRKAPLVPIVPPPVFQVRLLYPEPALDSQALETGLDRLLNHLAVLLEQEKCGARNLVLTAHRAEGGFSDVKVGFSSPLRDKKRMRRLVMERLDNIDPGFGIDALVLSAPQIENLAPKQITIDPSTHRDNEHVAELIDRLANRLEIKSIKRFAPVESYIPERAQTDAPAIRPIIWPEPALATNRPFRLLDHPEPITTLAEVPDGPPLSFKWRRISHRVARARGPERISPEWWQDGPGEDIRDYYEVEDVSGHRFWLYRQGLHQDSDLRGAPRWYLHGLFS